MNISVEMNRFLHKKEKILSISNIENQIGNVRWKKRFAILPVKLSNDDKIWLKPYYIKQKCCPPGIVVYKETPGKGWWRNDTPINEHAKEFANDYKINVQDAHCLNLTYKVLENLQPDRIMDNDPFLRRARLALLSAIVFSLYWKYEPSDNDFTHLFFMLNKTKDELEIHSSSKSLDYLWEEKKTPNHTGLREYKVFQMAAPKAREMVIGNILQNFETPAKCKKFMDDLTK